MEILKISKFVILINVCFFVGNGGGGYLPLII